jgi:hypothetical protein
VNRISPFARGMAIIAIVALAIVVLNLQASVTTAGTLIRFVFYLAIGIVAYMLWRDFGRREIAIWPRRSQWVFYSAAGLLLVDIGWWFATRGGGPDLLAAVLVAAACAYTGVKIWLEQHRYS